MHPAWKPRAPEWVTLAPGVQFLMRMPTGEEIAEVGARVARAIGSLQDGRGTLEDMGFDPEEMGALGDLNVLAGFSTLCAAVFYGEKLIEGWRGIDDAETGEAVEVEPETIRAVMRLGTPEGGSALMAPFMAWIDAPRIPIAAEMRRLRELALWEYGDGLTHCEGCDLVEAACAKGGTDDGDRCPRAQHAPLTPPGIAALSATRKAGVWQRAGLDGSVAGLDYSACLNLARAAAGADNQWLDEGALVRCLSAIEAGAMEAMAEKRKSKS